MTFSSDMIYKMSATSFQQQWLLELQPLIGAYRNNNCVGINKSMLIVVVELGEQAADKRLGCDFINGKKAYDYVSTPFN